MIVIASMLALVLLIGLAALLTVAFLHPSPERRRMQILTEELLAEQRVDAITRATIEAMRAAVRRELRSQRGGSP
jgi:hypothetical protein